MPRGLDRLCGFALAAIEGMLVFLLLRLLAGWLELPSTPSTATALVGAVLWCGRGRFLKKRGRQSESYAEWHGLADATDGETAARMRLAWKAGTDFLGGSRALRSLPWYLSTGHRDADRKALLDETAIPVSLPNPLTTAPEFTWHFAKNAVIIDAPFAMRRDDDNRWSLFLTEMEARRNGTVVAGLIVTLDAGRLVRETEHHLKAEAAALRGKIDQLLRQTGVSVPVYILVNRLDVLYGMRSLATRIPPGKLDEPLGSFRREDEPAGAFAQRCLAEAGRTLSQLAHFTMAQESSEGTARPSAGIAASLQAPAEFLRLESPLALFCREAFTGNPYQLAAPLRGIFLGTAGPKAETVPSLLACQPGLMPEDETKYPEQPWFLPAFLGEWLHRDRAPRRPLAGTHTQIYRVHPGLLSLFLGTLFLCWHMTWTFLDTRAAIGEVAAKGRAPSSVRDLETYLGITERFETNAAERFLSLVGRGECETIAAELRARFCESYRNLVLLPAVADLRRMAVAAGTSGDPVAIGNSVLAVTTMRRALSPSDASTRLANPPIGENAQKQLAAYMRWAPDPEEAAVLSRSLRETEKRLLAGACDGDFMRWLPRYIEEATADDPRVIRASWRDGSGNRRRPSGAWTLAGFEKVRAIFNGVGNAALEEKLAERYREEALAYWREQTATLWDGRLERLDDGDLHHAIQEAARGEDPAIVMMSLIRDNLLPMFPEPSGNADVEWLRRYSRALFPDENIQPDAGSADRLNVMFAAFEDIAVRSAVPAEILDLVKRQYQISSHALPISESAPDNPFADAKQASRDLDAILRRQTGSADWTNLSPVASYHYLRFLATRQAAVHLDDHWRAAVFNKAMASMGDDYRLLAGEGGFLEEFLNEFAGFWKYDAGLIQNADWDKLPFMFNRDFLILSNQALRISRLPVVDTLSLPFNVHSVAVDPAARERPTKVEFIWEGAAMQKDIVTFRNYQTKGKLRWWTGHPGKAAVRIHLPSLTLEKTFAGGMPLAGFVNALATGEMRLPASEFPDQAQALGRLGISAITIRADFEKPEIAATFLEYYGGRALDLPATIITRSQQPAKASPTTGITQPSPGQPTSTTDKAKLFGPRPVGYTVNRASHNRR